MCSKNIQYNFYPRSIQYTILFIYIEIFSWRAWKQCGVLLEIFLQNDRSDSQSEREEIKRTALIYLEHLLILLCEKRYWAKD